MKKNLVLVIVLVGFVAFATWMFMQRRQVAYVDTNVLMEKYKGMIEAKKEYKGKVKVWKANVDSLMKNWEVELKTYEKERTSMSKKEIKLKEELLRNKQQQIGNYQQAIQEKAMKEEQLATQTVVNQVNDYIKEYGEKHGYDFIYGANGTGNIVYANKDYDITEDVLKGLNDEYAN
jgi:outer membrane protein